MSTNAGWSFNPMAGKKLGRRSSIIAGWKRKRRAMKNPPLMFSCYSTPVLPRGFRGKLE